MKKIVMQLLADSLGLSRVTVWKVLNQKPGVAPATVKRVLDAVEELQEDETEERLPTEKLSSGSIALIASRADTSPFWMTIVEKIVSELNQNNLSLEYLPIHAMKLTDQQLSMLVSDKTITGAIVLNIYDTDTISTLRQIRLPKVFYDTVPGMTCEDLQADLLLLEGTSTLQKITDRLIQKGCRKIGFIGDIFYAKTNWLRWEGFTASMRKNHLTVDPNLCFTNMPDKIDYMEGIQAFLQQLKEFPEAFVCANDHIAFTVMRLLSNHKISVPQDLLLTGYDDQKEYMLEQNQVTTVKVRKGLLGKRMVHQLLYRLQNPQADFEEIQISPQILDRI